MILECFTNLFLVNYLICQQYAIKRHFTTSLFPSWQMGQMGADIFLRQTSVLKTNNGDIICLVYEAPFTACAALLSCGKFFLHPDCSLSTAHFWIKFEAFQHPVIKCCIPANVSYEGLVTLESGTVKVIRSSWNRKFQKLGDIETARRAYW